MYFFRSIWWRVDACKRLSVERSQEHNAINIIFTVLSPFVSGTIPTRIWKNSLDLCFTEDPPHATHHPFTYDYEIGWVRWSLVTLPTFWSLVTLPTSLGRVASDLLVFFLWPCSLKNTSHRILFLVVACDPTYLFGRVASDHFLALAIPKHLPWPDLHSDRIWPYSPTCHRKHGFCVAGATISMPLRCSPLTLYMLVGKCQMAFVWQVQQFWCLWDDLPWPYTCLLGRVASDWQWLCVAGAIFSMPPRSTLWPNVWRHWWPYLLFVWQVQYSRWLREVPCVRSACVAGAIF